MKDYLNMESAIINYALKRLDCQLPPKPVYPCKNFNNNWEEVPGEELWQDGELNSNQLMDLLYIRIIQEGEWRVIRRK